MKSLKLICLPLLFMFANHSESNPEDNRLLITHPAASIKPAVFSPKYATTLKLDNSSLKHQQIKTYNGSIKSININSDSKQSNKILHLVTPVNKLTHDSNILIPKYEHPIEAKAPKKEKASQKKRMPKRDQYKWNLEPEYSNEIYSCDNDILFDIHNTPVCASFLQVNPCFIAPCPVHTRWRTIESSKEACELNEINEYGLDRCVRVVDYKQ